jgi:hypothetical protein
MIPSKEKRTGREKLRVREERVNSFKEFKIQAHSLLKKILDE